MPEGVTNSVFISVNFKGKLYFSAILTTAGTGTGNVPC